MQTTFDNLKAFNVATQLLNNLTSSTTCDFIRILSNLKQTMALVTNTIFKNTRNKIYQVFIVSSLLVTASYGENILDPGNC